MSKGTGPRRGLDLAVAKKGNEMLSPTIGQTLRGAAPARHLRLAGPLACALAMSLLVSGSVTAYQLDREDTSTAPLVTPKRPTPSVSGQWVRLKLATPAGRRALEFG